MIQHNSDCVHFFQWCLPIMGYRWEGFKKVRRQVCRRISKRFSVLGLSDFPAYREYLEKNIRVSGCQYISGKFDPVKKTCSPNSGINLPEFYEWRILDEMCHITISRFYRDRSVFDTLRSEIIPSILNHAASVDRNEIRIWSAGCCSGEEPYTLSIIANDLKSIQSSGNGAKKMKPSVRIIGTEKHEYLLERANKAVYSGSSLKDLPPEFRERAFTGEDGIFRLKDEFKECVDFCTQDIRDGIPEGDFDLILCRNLVFTYYSEDFQREFLQKIKQVLLPGRCLVIGAHEKLPLGESGFSGNRSILVKPA